MFDNCSLGTDTSSKFGLLLRLESRKHYKYLLDSGKDSFHAPRRCSLLNKHTDNCL